MSLVVGVMKTGRGHVRCGPTFAGGVMSVMNFDQVAQILGAVGMSAAKEEPLDIEELSRDLAISPQSLRMVLEQVDRARLILLPPKDEPELPALLMRAGGQYLAMKGQVADEVLFFLPDVIDDLHARQALIHGGTVLVDEFRYAVVKGRAADHAAGVVPGAFVGAVDTALAVNLFAAAVALMARLSSGDAAGCLAEEIMAVALLENAEVWLDMQCDRGGLEADDAEAARGELRGVFELFEDDDVLNMFEMEEPADAAVAGHSWINRQAGVVDQRLESWFRPFGGVTGTGYLDERARKGK